jgi:prophage antirepressor-like protein
MEYNQIALFKGNKIRRTLHENEWWFSVVDVIGALTDTPNPRVYWGVMKNRLENDEKIELFTICKQLKLEAEDVR